MSYCRFSSNSFDSDVYVYRDGYVFVTHIAKQRFTSKRPRPKEPEDKVRAGLIALCEYHKDISEWLAHARLVDIGLEFDSKTHCHETAKECADNLMRLRSLGYHVPQSAIDKLRAEENNEKNKS